MADHAGAAARLADALRGQAVWCERLGSPLYADLLRRAADDAVAGGPVWEALRGHEDDPSESFLALRLMGAVHRLVLEGRAPSLAVHYPSAGGTPGEAWPAFQATVEDRLDEVQALLERPVQTNEVGRAAILLGGFLAVAERTGLPLRCLEVGASAGLNLRWDRFSYRSGDASWGDPDSPVRFTGVFEGAHPLEAVRPEVVERRGCDRAPVDATTEEGRLTLLSYVWPDMTDRLERLRGALQVAAAVPAPVDRADAVEWVEARLDPVPGTAAVLFHSIVAMYFEAEYRARFTAAIERAGERATADAPVAWLSVELGETGFETRLRLWPGGEDRLVARSGPHGPPVTWLGG
ncbi:MAG TPA: DUF2332 domain-containing protein [Actinomycetota bacterium]|nr:DUF2332 domain-containing protein [Actinomycetota bacterium]